MLTCHRFYFPPTFDNKHNDQGEASKKAFWIKHYDYGGTLLFSIGFVIFLLGLSWGGSVYPWTSGKVIGFIIGGLAILVVFVLYEIYMPLKAPFIPMHLFRNRGWGHRFDLVRHWCRRVLCLCCHFTNASSCALRKRRLDLSWLAW